MDEVTLPELPRHQDQPFPYFTEAQVREAQRAAFCAGLEHAAKVADALSSGVWHEACSGRAALDDAASAIRSVRVPAAAKRGMKE